MTLELRARKDYRAARAGYWSLPDCACNKQQ
jgi:hypothetical protein